MTNSKTKKLMQDSFDDALKDQVKYLFKNFVTSQENVRQEAFSGMGLKLAAEAYKMGLAAVEELTTEDDEQAK